MRASSFSGLACIALTVGCAGPDSAPTDRSAATSLLRASGPAVVSDPATGNELRRAAVESLRPESEGPAAFVLERQEPATPSRPVPGAGRVLAAAWLDGRRAIWVEAHAGRGELRLEDGASARVLDAGVLPEIAISPDGTRVLYARRTATGAELVLLDPATERRSIVYAGPTADRPVFRDDGRAVAFVGTGDGGFAALFVAEEGARARQLTNVGLRTGHGSPSGFVPPPLGTEGTAFTQDAIRYLTPDGRCTVRLPTGPATCTGEDP